MPHAITETAANADLNTGISLPDSGGDSFQDAATILEAAHQEHADRAQAQAKLTGVVMSGGLATKTILVPTAKELNNSGSIFTYVFSSGAHYWQQGSVASAGGLTFEVPPLPIGAKITGAYAWWANTNNTTLPVTTMPTLSLRKVVYNVGAASDPGSLDSLIASQPDTTAVSATYKLQHKIAITGLSEVVAADVQYQVLFAGEDGTNETTGGNLGAIFITLSV